jgi:hypothetical protein
VSVIRQPSLFGAQALPPAPGDLAGLLLAGGAVAHWQAPTVQRPAAGAQVSIVVDHPWRASVLVMECARRGLAATQMISARAGEGHSYRIVGKRRLGRLAELVGDPPKRAPTDIWPS